MSFSTPFFNRAEQLAKLRARFFVPGHKGNAAFLSPFASVLAFDLTEIDGADDLSHPSGPLAESQQNMARAFGSAATLYSAFGTSSCIKAMLHLYLRPEQPVLMARGCHISALRSLVFTGAVPVWLPLKNGQLSPEKLEKTLQQYPKSPVYVTSFDYYGRGLNIAALANVCQRYGSPLLVDNAHGAHLAFLKPSLHPLHLGATAVADSAHKTLPCLTGAALLHLQTKEHATLARELLNLYGSTSPSYLVLESMDLCAGQLLAGVLDFETSTKQLAAVKQMAAHLCEPVDDPFKLCLNPALSGWQAQTVMEHLKERGILPEFYDGTRLVLMASCCNRPEDFDALADALSAFASRPAFSPVQEEPFMMPTAVCSPREAYFSPKQRIATASAAGRVVAGLSAPCPPGVPLLAPGERISECHIQAMLSGGILELDVVK